jgi:hypothetical protein
MRGAAISLAGFFNSAVSFGVQQLFPRGLETIGPANAIKDIPFALQLARAGKVPNPLSPHKAKDNDEVKRLWKLLEKEAKGQPRRATATHPDAVQEG